MPRIHRYEVVARVESRLCYTSAIQETLCPDDMTDEQVVEAIDHQINRVWAECMAGSRPFQLGLCRGLHARPTTVTVAPHHLISLQTTLLGSRPATSEEIKIAETQLPEIRFHQTEQPPADDEGLPAGSQPV